MGQTDLDVDKDRLRKRVLQLQKELKDATDKLQELDGDVSTSSSMLPPPGKSGYLFKWQDRSIGW